MGRIRITKSNMSPLDIQIHDWRLGNNIVLLYSQYESLTDLEEDFDDFNNMDLVYRNISNDKSIELFGKTNVERYDSMLHKMYSRPDDVYGEIKRVSNEDNINISPLEKLFLLRETAINKNYIDNINKSKYIKFIQEDSSIYDITHDKDIIKEEILSKLESDNIYDDVGIVFPFLSLEAMMDDNGNLDPQDDDQEIWQRSYKKMMVTGDAKDYMNLATYWKNIINDTYNLKKESEKHGDKDTVEKCNKILIGYGWAPAIDPNTSTINKASEITKERIEKVLTRMTMIDLTKDNNIEEGNDDKISSINPYLYIAAFKLGSKYTNIVISSDKDLIMLLK